MLFAVESKRRFHLKLRDRIGHEAKPFKHGQRKLFGHDRRYGPNLVGEVRHEAVEQRSGMSLAARFWRNDQAAQVDAWLRGVADGRIGWAKTIATGRRASQCQRLA